MKHHTDGPSRRPTPAQRLAGAAGRLTGLRAGKGERRGSVLVLILGGLALLSVVAVVYVTVGQSDRRTGATTRSRDSVQDTAQGVASYLSGVIGDDALATSVDGVDPQMPNPADPTAPGPILIREAHDYPSTDFTLRTHAPGNNVLPPYEQFNPVGSYDTIWTTGLDLRTPTDPWLASSEPTYLLGPTAAAPPPNEGFTFRLDWAQVSNPAPSGNPVNLYNLRGNFDASPGFSPNPFFPPPNNAKMSDRLSLFDANNFPNNLAGAGGRVTTLGFNPGRVADPLRPAHWTTFQVGAFRPARDVDVGPEDARYLHYQWADADGDGYFDSRWFELVDISDPDNPFSILPKDDRFRWFIAPRIIDLSGRINLNTATDFRNPPTPAAVAGMTPADVDLLRVLRMDDAFARYMLGGTALDYQIIAEQLSFTGPLDAVLEQYRSLFNANRAAVGHYGYDAIRIALRDFSVPPFGAAINTAPLQQSPLTAAERAEFYRRAGSRGDGASLGSFVTGTPPNTPVFTSGGVFGQSDLLELLAQGGLNEPGEPSRLEAAGGGRFAPPIGGNPQTTGRLSPLRDNWTMAFERGRIDDDPPPSVPGLADDEALAMRALDPRLLLTTHSGGRPIVSQVIAPNAASALSATRDLKVDVVSALEDASDATVANRDASKLFAAYADALMPHSWRENAWDYVTTPNPKFALAYGGTPLLALWTAGHLTANAIDMYDRDEPAGGGPDRHEPSAFTMAVSGYDPDLAAIGTAQQRFPYWEPSTSTGARAGSLDLDRALGLTGVNPPLSRMARQGNLPAAMPTAMNIFGVEAQPFIVEVASITIYTDAPWSAYADPTDPGAEEYVDPGFPPTIPPNEINIKGDVVSSNPDIICQILAFQITNPFDTDVPLTGSGSGTGVTYTDYYLEFAGNYFRLESIDQAGQVSPVTLDRRDPTNATRSNTRVFYALNSSFEDILDRLRDAAPVPLSGNLPQAPDLQALIDRQLSTVFGATTVAPTRIPRMDPATGAVAPAFTDLLGTVPEATRAVKLWRSIDSAAITGTAPANPREDDLLADRIRDPGDTTQPPTLDVRLPAGQQDVQGTQAGPDPTRVTGSVPEDNTGFSIMMWSSFKRMDDPRAGDPATGAIIPKGAFPAYCVEMQTRPNWLNSGTYGNQPNPGDAATALRDCDFTVLPCPAPRPNAVGDAYLYRRPVTGPSLVSRISQTNYLGQITPPSNTARSYIGTPPEEKSEATHVVTGYDVNYPEIHLDNDRFGYNPTGTPPTAATIRVADMLLPLAVGPTWIPPTTPTPDLAEWLTLGESMSVALGYSVPQLSDPYFGFLNGFYQQPASGQQTRNDRGQLILSAFAPFEDTDGNGVYNAPVTGGNDVPRWPGVPLALRVLDVFTTAPRELGSLEHATPGLLNLNTAAGRALSAVPLLIPNGGTAVTGPAMWWGSSGTNLPPAPPAANAADIASSLEAYRDKLEVENAFVPPVAVRFDDTNRATLDDPSTWTGRFETNQIAAVREAPGFSSLGEIMGVTEKPLAATNRTPPGGRIDRLGEDTMNNGHPGVDSILYRSASGGPVNSIDEITDDFSEKLAVAAAVTNSVSVRSDVFAVWFVLHGYQRSDTEGLSSTAGSADPLTPTIAKRYLMIVDRSNVTRKGDKPRILMMQELPL